jgi:beta-1,4-mannosyltransferase
MKILAWPAFRNKSRDAYNWQLYKALEAIGADVSEYSLKKLVTSGYDVFHVHWPDGSLNYKNPVSCLMRIFYFFTVLCIAKIRGAKIIWTVHNLHPHESFHPIFERAFWIVFLRMLDGYISLSESGHFLAQSTYPALRRIHGEVTRFGHFRNVYPDSMSRDDARKRLGISSDARVLLFLGLIRPYKNVPELIRVFRETGCHDSLLVIAGECNDHDLEGEVRRSAEGDCRIRLHLDFIPCEEIQIYFKASNLTVLPYKDILNSGAALLSLSFSVPVLVPDKGAMQELKLNFGEGWVRTYHGVLEPETLMDALVAVASSRSGGPDMTEYGWDKIAKRTLQFYSRLVGVSLGNIPKA